MEILRVLAYTIVVILNLFELVLILRAICSWAPYFRQSKVNQIATIITEPIVAPIRKALMRISFIRRCPIDLSFIVLYIVISLASNALIAFIYA